MTSGFAFLTTLSIAALALAQQQFPGALPRPVAPTPPIVERLGPTLIRVGSLQVETAAREVTLTGRINPVTTLEFIANTRNGVKAYESAITVDTSGVALNTALLLIGLDRAHARVPTRHLDPNPFDGDHVQISVEWMKGSERVRVDADSLIFDKPANQVAPSAPWVYTGSTIVPNVGYLADVDGVLIWFARSPAPIIESPRVFGMRKYGDIVLNPNLGLIPDMPVTLIVKAVSNVP